MAEVIAFAEPVIEQEYRTLNFWAAEIAGIRFAEVAYRMKELADYAWLISPTS